MTGDEVFALMKALRDFNYERIYHHPEVQEKSEKSDHIVELLFGSLSEMLEGSERGANAHYIRTRVREAPTCRVFFDFIKNTNFTEKTPVPRIVADYIAGMTDLFAQRTYMELFLPKPVV